MALIPTSILALLVPSGTPTGAAGAALKGNFETLDAAVGELQGDLTALTTTVEGKADETALTDGLALKLNIAGGTLTGAIAGTAATFSGTVTANTFSGSGALLTGLT